MVYSVWLKAFILTKRKKCKLFLINFKSRFGKKNILGKIKYILIDFSFNLLRDFTIPSCEKEKWNKKVLLIMPYFSTLFILLITGSK